MAAAAVLVGASLSPLETGHAANSTCATAGSTANCTDVPADGISYTGGINTVNITAPSGTTAVNAGTIGILLTQSGVSGGSGSSFNFTVIAYDHDDDEDTDDINVVSANGTSPLLLNGNIIIANGNGSFTSGGTNYPNVQALAAQFGIFSGSAGGGANLTVNNPGPFDGSAGASFTTTSNDGIFTRSSGGNGGHGGCFTILLATWCDDGGDGNNGGSVTVNSNGTVTVNGGTTNQHGVVAISQGGNGGDGGGSFGLFASDAGAGGDGGNGGAVSVTLGPDSVISTSNNNGSAVYALSAGGNGGTGGAPSGIVAIGDDGGNGGNGGSVTVVNNGSITTSGHFAHGIYAGSIGAGAGSGSDVGGIVALGGRGGGTANGGSVSVTNSGAIQTSGNNAYGIFAQSVGGGGGDGGSSGGIVAIGGGTGSAGHGGTVTVAMTSTGSIVTTGTASYGIFAQSVGGGGGTAGFGGGVVGIGGFGGGGGNGSTVTVNTGEGSTISTSGQSAHAIFAQSIGGGGGTSGTGGGVVGVGATGGSGGSGGTVTVISGSTITTTGIDARGILAQSIGGGGGSANGSGGVVAVGGSGGGGGNASSVTVTNSGSITTQALGADAIYAQSIGGGGGSGASSGGVVSVGGGGDTGGSGSTVTVTNSGTLTTNGDLARGIFAQSVGGGGGSGGHSGGVISIGGAGSVTSSGGAVTVDNSGSITTNGAFSTAIYAQSVGGGGGDGGTSGGLVTIGGAGNGGGGAGTVTVTSTGDLSTAGDDAHAIFAQSIGGGGGNGGGAASGSVFFAAAIGGSGGGGGNGNAVSVILGNESVMPGITTTGDRANGIFAQSVGGGGGNGGFAVAASVGYILSTSVAVGGTGEGGGNGSTVNVSGNAIIDTSGENSDGILAQSVGGGGGNGGFAVSFAGAAGETAGAAFAVGVGGAGGGGGTGGNVTVNAGGSIRTTGDLSEGLIAQSVGGGGGNGGFNVTISAAGAGAVAGSVSVGVGGQAGSGGDGGTVSVTYGGDVWTEGADSDAIIAQSVGGGGGNGGYSVSGAVSGSGSGSAAVAVGVGGAGGDGGDGDEVTANITGNLVTWGDRSDGLVAQSVGGGGGNGGLSVTGGISISGGPTGVIAVGVGGAGGGGGDASTVNATLTGNIITLGADSDGFLAQSLGGGGGNGAINVTAGISGSSGASGTLAIGVGGFGGDGGSADFVEAMLTGNVITLGDRSDAFVAQSLGGGGGNGGLNVTAGVNVSGGAGGTLALGVGGFGGGGGASDNVEATMTGNIFTFGMDANGFLAQSIGGGGGNGGLNVSGGVNISAGAGGTVSVGVGGFGGDGGSAGSVTATHTGNVSTGGDRANAFIAQSLGGGGGNGGLNVSGGLSASSSGTAAVTIGVGGFGGDGGSASSVTATLTGDVMTSGADADAILAQSLGGGGGNGGLNVSGALAGSSSGSGAVSIGIGGFGGGGGDAGNVGLTTDGDVTTTGAGSGAILAQSLGGGGGNGGLNVSGALSASSSSGGAISLGLGGFGGDGGNAGTVTASVTGTVDTSGADAPGVMAQSLGGGGGNGGLNVSGSVGLSSSTAGSAAVGIGGFGGGGGNAGNVSLTRSGDTFTSGARSDAIVAQSFGGGGGNGGLNISGAISGSSGSSSFAIALGLGGFGGDGGNAGSVTVDVDGNVLATGIDSDTTEEVDDVMRRTRTGGSNGILAQSIGGSGGNGAINVSAGVAITTADSTTGALTLGVGGFGGGGGNAGAVTLTADGEVIQAAGDYKIAVAAQSIGGGGGNGGINISAGVTMKGALTAGVGGFGGDGGTGAAVNATVNADIFAAGNSAVGFLAQSVGGGGGNGGINISGGLSASTSSDTPSLVFGLGGFGGDGNVSGDVTAVQLGSVIVEGADANGVMVQSIAGGGGNGALNVSGNISLGKGGYTGAIGVGGSGGEGADAGDVMLTSDGTILLDGRGVVDSADETGGHGILVQSVGGGGGNGGINVAGVIAPQDNPFVIGVGGSGSGGGDAGNVTVIRGLNEAALISTQGRNVNGLTAQSIGGGGGNGGINVVSNTINTGAKFAAQIAVGGSGAGGGDGGDVSVTHNGDILTAGDLSKGLFAQSVGGGGGSATFNLGASKAGSEETSLDLTVGGQTGDGGIAGDVTVTHTGDIATEGDDSAAIHAQSVAGGGGDTGFDMAMSIGAKNSLSIGIGQLGGTGGSGGDVTVTSDGTLMTFGDRSTAIFAQSIGGGGGASSAHSVGLGASSGSGDSAKSVGVGVAVGLQGGEGGFAGDVSIDASGVIGTAGDEAHGIHAQSIGGGGGNGGGVLNLVIQETHTARVGVGGTGGTGGVAGTVDIDNSAIVETLGDGSHGIFAQSIGGGGGTGGYAATASFLIGGSTGNGTNSLTATVGGSGGTGATANVVTVTNSGRIATTGDDSHGINAQSIGGGGGDGGIAVSGTLAGSGRSSSLGLVIGGEGGDGGTGDSVIVTNSSVITTAGDMSAGIKAQSVGGGGGDAGLLAQVSIAKGSSDASSADVSINIGGTGGTGGTAGDVTVTNEAGATIQTLGDNGYGIFAQSIGGGGGNGSSVISANFTGGANSTFVGLNIGGAGGTGGHGGDVLVNNAGLIATEGDNAHGIFAQSIGGGGGNGGLAIATNGVIAKGGGAATPLVAVGGAGGDGEDAGDVTVNNSGRIVTQGDNAHGILAQSIGGGGGNANVGFGLTSGIPSTIIANTISAIAGAVSGGDGGAGGHVTVNHSGDITVFGDGAQAIKAESINGGGGSLVLDFNGITSVPGGASLPLIPGGVEGIATDPVLTLIAGSTGSTNSSAESVTVNITGTIGAAGDNGAGYGVLSVGGGGGTMGLDLDLLDSLPQLALVSGLGGTNGQNNNGGLIDTTHTGDLITEGRNTLGLILQSIGGGGGRANLSVFSDAGLDEIDLSLGGTNGLNENGGSVFHTQTGSVVTLGDNAFGVFAQSVGGGGGLLSMFLGPQEGEEEAGFAPLALGPMPLMAPPPVVAAITLGASGGSGLDGGDVNLTLTGDSLTLGDHSIAHFHQSVGAGGGGAIITGADILNVTLGGTGGAEGNGGDITIDNSGMVLTEGFRSHAIFLQSVGGGGGAIFHDAGTVNLTLRSDNEGNGGDIVLDQTGTVMTTGDEAHGIVAQTIGGGGGWIDGAFAGTAGGDGAGGFITLDIDGHVDTSGDGSIAIFAQSVGAAGSGDILINLTADHTVHGGTGGGAGVVFDGGADNLLNNAGTVTSRNDQAVLGSYGNELIENTGNLIGNVELDGGTNVINNRADGFFLSLDRIYLTDTDAAPPAANTYTNEGEHAVYGVDTPGLTSLWGNMVQTDTGLFNIDVDLNNQDTDRVNITGTGDFDGLGELLFQSIDKKFDEYVIAQAQQGMTDSGFEPFFQLPTVGFDWKVKVENDTDLVLYADKPLFEDLMNAASVDGNVVAMGAGLDDAEAVLSIDDPFNRLINLLRFQPDVETLGDAMASLTPSAAPHLLEMEHRRSLAYLDFVQDCPYTANVLRFNKGDGCLWFRVAGGGYARESRDFSPVVDDIFASVSIGIRAPVREDWVVGVGIEKGAGKSEFNRDGEFHSRFEKDWVLTHAHVGWDDPASGFSVGLTVAGGFGDFEAKRRVQVNGFTEFFTTYDGIGPDKQPIFTDRSRTFEGISGVAAGESDMWSLNTRLRLSYLWGETFQIRPMLDVDGFYSKIGAYTEDGVGLANLTYPEWSDSLVTLAPATEFAWNGRAGERAKLRAYVRPSVLFSVGDAWAVGTHFAAAPEGLDPILIREAMDDPLFRIHAGVQAIASQGIGLTLDYGGGFGALTESHEFTGRLTIRY